MYRRHTIDALWSRRRGWSVGGLDGRPPVAVHSHHRHHPARAALEGDGSQRGSPTPSPANHEWPLLGTLRIGASPGVALAEAGGKPRDHWQANSGTLSPRLGRSTNHYGEGIIFAPGARVPGWSPSWRGGAYGATGELAGVVGGARSAPCSWIRRPGSGLLLVLSGGFHPRQYTARLAHCLALDCRCPLNL